jgi:hypothetical protein
VAIPLQRKQMRIGDQTTFGLGINNIQRNTETFYVELKFNKAYHANNSENMDASKDFIEANWMYGGINNYVIQPNKYQPVPLYISPDGMMSETKTTIKGTYVFDVCVCKHDPCAPCVKGATQLYDGYVHKIYVEII